MGKRERRTFTEEFKQEAVRLAETSGRTVAKIAEDLGLGLATLTRWKRRYRETDLPAGPHQDTAKELARLRKEKEFLRQERETLKLQHGRRRRWSSPPGPHITSRQP